MIDGTKQASCLGHNGYVTERKGPGLAPGLQGHGKPGHLNDRLHRKTPGGSLAFNLRVLVTFSRKAIVSNKFPWKKRLPRFSC